jgi:hypothetical protein
MRTSCEQEEEEEEEEIALQRMRTRFAEGSSLLLWQCCHSMFDMRT